jgi:hypothetical protein
MFPDDARLIAIGKYSVMSRERHDQLKRVQEVCRTIQATVPKILADFQEEPLVDEHYIPLLEKCVANLASAKERIITMCLGMAEIKPEAWPK